MIIHFFIKINNIHKLYFISLKKLCNEKIWGVGLSKSTFVSSSKIISYNNLVCQVIAIDHRIIYMNTNHFVLQRITSKCSNKWIIKDEVLDYMKWNSQFEYLVLPKCQISWIYFNKIRLNDLYMDFHNNLKFKVED